MPMVSRLPIVLLTSRRDRESTTKGLSSFRDAGSSAAFAVLPLANRNSAAVCAARVSGDEKHRVASPNDRHHARWFVESREASPP